MAKSKKERRSSIRHMQAEGDVLGILEALDRAVQDEKTAERDAAADSEDLEDGEPDDR